jgi:acyl-CoA synthetase (AMP-forming)/AMP-acid ligase II
VVFEDGEQWTYSELRRRVMHVAASLQQAGVAQGDFVLSWQGNGPVTLLTWFGLNYLGAVYVPINTSYRGRLLEHVIANSDATLMIADARLIDRLARSRSRATAPSDLGWRHLLARRAARDPARVHADQRAGGAATACSARSRPGTRRT